jgi:hypothetical protein
MAQWYVLVETETEKCPVASPHSVIAEPALQLASFRSESLLDADPVHGWQHRLDSVRQPQPARPEALAILASDHLDDRSGDTIGW